MLFDTLIAEARHDDGLDEVRRAALGRVRWLTELLEQQRAEAALQARQWLDRALRRQREAAGESIRAEIDVRLAACGDDEGRAAVVCLMLAARFDETTFWQYDREVRSLLPRLRGWTPAEVVVLLRRAHQYDMGFWFAQGLEWALHAAERLDADGLRAVAPWLRHAHAEVMRVDVGAAERRSLSRRLRTLIAAVDEALIPEGLMPAHAPWAAPLRELADAAPTRELADFVRHLASLSGPRPSRPWRRTCLELLDAAAVRELLPGILRELAEGEPMCSRTHDGGGPALSVLPLGVHYHFVVHDSDGDLARGLLWACALALGPATAPLLEALALRTGGPGGGVRQDLKVAGAAVNALAETDDPAALESLWRLRSAIRDRALRKQIDTALRTAAGRQGITPEQLVERSVPDHGLGADGSVGRELGGHRARVAIEDAVTVRLAFTGPDGRTSRSAPVAVTDGFPEELRELKALAKEIRATLSAERSRLEALMSQSRVWPYDEWCRHYAGHPVTGAVVRGLIWEFRATGGDWHATAPGARPPGGATHVRLWHPIRASVDGIAAWRERLVAERLRQPFKQAFRESYLLTPAEEETRVYSNRFAAHIVHYRQLYALFKERGWQAQFLGNFDGGGQGRARGEFGGGEWRATFDHSPAEGGEGGAYAPAYASTDQVRFERRDGRVWREALLADVPPVVFSEAMRDVDLFVGVTSIAADPEWTDAGEDRYRAYWHTTAFGELGASAEVRREALARILPRLRIAGRCELRGRYLRVRGDVGTYRIHLGSGNVLMEPGDTYLCIVAAPGRRDGGAFLPFEDARLSLILSKAMLLAADSRITDRTILRQLGRAA